jgi:iron(III) transport system substrate-binding protein
VVRKKISLAIFSSFLLGASSILIGSNAKAAETLNVYAALDYSTDVTKAFTAKTGIPVNLVALSTGPLLAKIQAEKNNPQWGVYWADGAEPCAAMDLDKQLLPYKPSYAHALTLIGKKLQPKNSSYTVPGYTEMVGVVYNAAKVAKPKSFQDLLTAAYKGQVGMNNPSISGPTYPFIAGLMTMLGGEDQGKAYLTSLKANGLVVNAKNGPTLHALEVGTINVALVQSSAAINEVNTFQAKPVAGFNPQVTFLSKTTLLPSCLAIDAHVSTTQQNEAKQFADYVMSDDGQSVMQKGALGGDSLYFPTMTGLSAVPAVTVSSPTLASGIVQVVDPYLWGPKQGEIDDWFTKNIA